MYFYVLEGKVARLDKLNNPYGLHGLCTDNFTSCNIITIVSRDKNRFVMIHGDASLNEAVLREQLAWVGGAGNASLSVHRRGEGYVSSHSPQSSEATRNRLLGRINYTECYGWSETLVPSDMEAVVLNVEQDEPQLMPNIPNSTLYHPQSKIIATRHCIENMSEHARQVAELGNSYVPPLIFDGQSYVLYDGFELSEETKRYFALANIRETQDLHVIFNNPTFTQDIGFKAVNTVYVFYYFRFHESQKNPSLEEFLKCCIELLPPNIKRDTQAVQRFLSIKTKDDVGQIITEINFSMLCTPQTKSKFLQTAFSIGESFQQLFDRYPQHKYLAFSPPAPLRAPGQNSIYVSIKEATSQKLREITGMEWGVNNEGSIAMNNNVDPEAFTLLEPVLDTLRRREVSVTYKKPGGNYQVILRNIRTEVLSDILPLQRSTGISCGTNV